MFVKYNIKNNIKYIIKESWNLEKGLFTYLFFYTILTSIRPFIAIVIPKFIIDELTSQARVNELIKIVIIYLILSVMVNYFIEYIDSARISKTSAIRFALNRRIVEKTMKMDYKYTESSKIMNENYCARKALSGNSYGVEGIIHKLFEFSGKFIGLMGYVAIIFTLNPLIMIYLCLNVIIIYFISLKVKKYEYSKKNEVADLERKLTYIFNTMSDFSYGKDIRIYNIKSWLSKQFQTIKNKRVNINNSIILKNLKVDLIDIILLLIRDGIVYGYLIYKVVYHNMSIGNFAMYFMTVTSFAAWLEGIIKDLAFIKGENFYVNDYRNFIESYDNDVESDRREIPREKQYELRFKNVSFKYPDSQKYIFKNLNLHIKKGQKIAIVGVNGAGKTTLVKLLTKLYDVEEGAVLLNGIDIKNFKKEEYFNLFSVVFQEIKILAFSVAENIALKKKDKIDREKVIGAIDKAGLKDKIEGLEYGIDNSLLKILDNKGTELSGGENQKLALARALYKDAPIIILDEPTAALDPLAEYNIYKGFNDLIGNKTAVYISHRLSSTRFCDVIAFFEDGEIKEYGTHYELMAQNGKYAHMFNMQAQYYKESVEEAN